MKLERKKPKLYGIDVPFDIFDDNLNVLYGDFNLAVEYCESKGCKFNKDESHELADGFCIRNKTSNYVYIGKDLNNYTTIVHELMHGIMNITYLRNIAWSDTPGPQQELFCYLSGFAVNYVLATKPKKWFVWENKKWLKQ